MADYRPPLRDIAFVLDHLVDHDALVRLPRYAHADLGTVVGFLEEYGRFVASEVAPLNRVGDLEASTFDADAATVTTAPGFKQAFDGLASAGWTGVPFPEEYGGGGFPWAVGVALQEILCAANTAFSMAPYLTQGAIELLLRHGSEEQKERYLRKLVTCEWTATMNLTEPEAGSDVGALRTRAVPQPDGTYRITGTKIFISFGEHDLTDNVVHLVLARTPGAPPGTKGISCFIVPKFLVDDDGSIGARNDVRCVSIEHKMGIRASPTCVMSYGEDDGAVGYLIGEENQGMRCMFTMMNNARLSVGVQGLALSERAYQDALEYAQERRQGRAPGAERGAQSPIVEHPDVRRMLLTMKSLIDGMRAVVYECAVATDLAEHADDEAARAANQDIVDFLIPVAKAWCTDMACEVTSLAIQVYGGMGYIEESGVSQHYRDARITTIYEGTNGIQAMDLIGRKLGLRGGAAVEQFLATIAAVDADLEKAGPELEGIRREVGRAVTVLGDTTRSMMEAGLADPRDALAAATPYLRMFGLVVAGWLLARQAVVASDELAQGATGDDAELLTSKVVTAQFFCEQLLPAVHGLVPAATAPSDVLFALDATGLGGVR